MTAFGVAAEAAVGTGASVGDGVGVAVGSAVGVAVDMGTAVAIGDEAGAAVGTGVSISDRVGVAVGSVVGVGTEMGTAATTGDAAREASATGVPTTAGPGAVGLGVDTGSGSPQAARTGTTMPRMKQVRTVRMKRIIKGSALRGPRIRGQEGDDYCPPRSHHRPWATCCRANGAVFPSPASGRRPGGGTPQP